MIAYNFLHFPTPLAKAVAIIGSRFCVAVVSSYNAQKRLLNRFKCHRYIFVYPKHKSLLKAVILILIQDKEKAPVLGLSCFDVLQFILYHNALRCKKL